MDTLIDQVRQIELAARHVASQAMLVSVGRCGRHSGDIIVGVRCQDMDKLYAALNMTEPWNDTAADDKE